MQIIKIIKEELMIINDRFMQEAEDNYNFWEEHIKYVVQEALILAKKYSADEEIVELSAMLHDIALMLKIGTRADHHIIGAEIAVDILKKYNYPSDKIQRVNDCILNHRSSKNGKTIEEICVADADVLAHFDNITMIFNNAFNRNNLSLSEIRTRLKIAFEKDYNDLSNETKKEFACKYNLICDIVLGK